VAWLYRVARNRAIDVLRRRKRVRTDLETIEAVEVVRFAPVERGIKCVPKGPTASDCNTPLDFGTATVWIDDATHVVLKYEANLANPHSMMRTTVFQVTSFIPGQGATQAQLSERSPVPVQPFRHDSIGTSGRGRPPRLAAPVPPGFLPAPAPAELPNALSDEASGTLLESVTDAARPRYSLWRSADRTPWLTENVIPYDGRYIVTIGRSKGKGHTLMHRFEAAVRPS